MSAKETDRSKTEMRPQNAWLIDSTIVNGTGNYPPRRRSHNDHNVTHTAATTAAAMTAASENRTSLPTGMKQLPVNGSQSTPSCRHIN